jgi:hypothetical protein
VAKVNGGYKLGSDLRATNLENRHEIVVIGGSGLVGTKLVTTFVSMAMR